MSDTPRTDAAEYRQDDTVPSEPLGMVDVDFARQLERELAKAEERNRFLVDSYAKAHEEICQTAGKALGYPWLKDDQKNFPGATDADGVCVGEHVADTIVAELAQKYTEAKERIKRLEEALESVAREVPAQDGGGGLFWPMFDGEGNEVGIQQVDPITVIGAMHQIAVSALQAKESK